MERTWTDNGRLEWPLPSMASGGWRFALGGGGTHCHLSDEFCGADSVAVSVVCFFSFRLVRSFVADAMQMHRIASASHPSDVFVCLWRIRRDGPLFFFVLWKRKSSAGFCFAVWNIVLVFFFVPRTKLLISLQKWIVIFFLFNGFSFLLRNWMISYLILKNGIALSDIWIGLPSSDFFAFLLSKSAERQRRFRAREQSMKPKKKTTKDSEIQTETVEEDESDDRPLSAAKMAANDARTWVAYSSASPNEIRPLWPPTMADLIWPMTDQIEENNKRMDLMYSKKKTKPNRTKPRKQRRNGLTMEERNDVWCLTWLSMWILFDVFFFILALLPGWWSLFIDYPALRFASGDSFGWYFFLPFFSLVLTGPIFFIGRHSAFSFVFLPSFTGFYFEIVSHFDAMKNFVLFSLFIFEKKMHFKANCWVLVFLFVGNKIRNKKKEWMNRRATDRIDLIGRWRHGQSHFFVQIAEHREE